MSSINFFNPIINPLLCANSNSKISSLCTSTKTQSESVTETPRVTEEEVAKYSWLKSKKYIDNEYHLKGMMALCSGTEIEFPGRDASFEEILELFSELLLLSLNYFIKSATGKLFIISKISTRYKGLPKLMWIRSKVL